jgi:hypothetical protein
MSALSDLGLTPRTPRAIAVLVALRSGPRSVNQIADAIADTSAIATAELVALLMTAGTGLRLVQPVGRLYGLTYDGLAWLQSHGLDATPAAKQALYDATDARQARSEYHRPDAVDPRLAVDVNVDAFGRRTVRS